MLSETCLGDFHGGPVVKDPPSNAENIGVVPGQGLRFPHATGQLHSWDIRKSLCATQKEKKKRNMLVKDAFLWVSPWGWYMKARKPI